MKTKSLKILLLLAIILLPWGAAKAMETKAGNSIYVPKEEIIAGNLYAAGSTVTIDGDVGGDLIAAAQTINVNGRIEGDIIAAAQNIVINGEVGGNIRVAGNSLTVNGIVARNVNLFGANIVIGNNAKIGWDVFTAAANVEVRGDVAGTLSGQAEKVTIAGKIGKNINLKLSGNESEELTIAPGASVVGNLTYTSINAAKIPDSKAVGGKIQQNIPEIEKNQAFVSWLFRKLFAIFSALVVGLALVLILKKIIPKILARMEENPLKTMLPGLIIMFIIPPIALILILTFIGIPLALIISAWWLVATYLARIFAAVLVGQIIIKYLFKKNNFNLIWSLILGVFVCWLLFAIPFVGWIIYLFVTWLGLGGIYLFAINQFKSL